jgi:hypothetical protein
MAVTSIMTTGAEIAAKMGANVSASFTEAMQDAIVLQAESAVNILARENYSDSVAGLNADVKGIFSDIVSSMVAIQGIMYDMSGYTSRIEAEDMINVLRDGILRNMSLLRDKKQQRFIDEA